MNKEDSRILERQNMLQISQVFIPWALRRDQAVLPFKDSQGGTWPLELQDFRMTLFWRRAPVKKQSRYPNRAKTFTPQQKFGPAISEAAEPRCDTPSATKLSHTPRRSEAPPR